MRIFAVQFVPVHVANIQAILMLVPFTGQAHSFSLYILAHDLLTQQCHSATFVMPALFLVQTNTLLTQFIVA